MALQDLNAHFGNVAEGQQRYQDSRKLGSLEPPLANDKLRCIPARDQPVYWLS